MFGIGDERHLHPLVSDDGPVLWPIDRQTIALVWSERGYPAAPAYRNHHGLTTHHHRVWRNDGEPYDPVTAQAQGKSDAADFVARVRDRVAAGGVCVFALDTELLGHWWYEGVSWLSAVLDETARQGLELIALDDALERYDPLPGAARAQRHLLGERRRPAHVERPAGRGYRVARTDGRAADAADGRSGGERALRELLALQSSDWAFLVSRGGAGDYPLERLAGHAAALEAALESPQADPALRNLAPVLAGWGL